MEKPQTTTSRAAAPQGTQTHEELLDRYIDVILRIGINIQPGQTLVVNTDPAPEFRALTHRLAERAYALGAGEVIANWRDRTLTRLRALHASEAALCRVPTWRALEYETLDREGAAYLSLTSPDPDAMAGVDPARMALQHQAAASVMAPHWNAEMADQHVWCIVSVATPAWARLVFPDLSPEAGLARLWDVIFTATRATAPNPVAAWDQHIARLASIQGFLNEHHFTRLRYTGPGTDLVVTLPDRHLWLGATSTTPQGHIFVPNIPTEEVFTLPLRTGVDGTVRGTFPFDVGGQSIEGLSLTFERGHIVKYSAEVGGDALREVIESDEGSHYLGEAALAPLTSPCNIGRPTHDTLYDENASCHLAVGEAYATNLQGGQTLSREELAAAGANTSTQHVDFMIGSPDLLIVGETATGERHPLIEHGDWSPTLLSAIASGR